MPRSPALEGWKGPRLASLLVGLAMVGVALLAVRLYVLANFPATVYEGSALDLGDPFNCDAALFGRLAHPAGVPLGWFGAALGGLVVLGALFPSERLERTNAFLAVVNGVAVAALATYALLVDRSVCPYCAGYWLLALASVAVFGWSRARGGAPGAAWHGFVPSLPVLAVFVVLTGAGAFGLARYTAAERLAQEGGDAARAVREFLALPRVAWPSIISPFWAVRSTERFEDAPIRVVEYSDLLCPDCLVLYRQLRVLQREFAGRLNVAFQPFPLDTSCNGVVNKHKHRGSCEVTRIALATGPGRFPRVHDEIFEHFRRAKTDPEWRAALARRYGVAGAPADTAVSALLARLIETGREYEPTSERYPYGIRSTPTLIVNNRMIIGTLPTAQLRAIFRALADPRGEAGGQRFLERWVP